MEEVEINQLTDDESHLESASVAPGPSKATTEDPGEDSEHLSIDGEGSVRSVSSLGWTASLPPASRGGLASSHSRRSSCSTVRITEEQLMLNPVGRTQRISNTLCCVWVLCLYLTTLSQEPSH